ncbi:MAG: RNA polymerase sigma factor [Oscillospiraceae bacterium]|jgi:RNA polymerase sigma-70 factor (ECF subfamily)|nr:RNA polymerase sigma factor [Oscillospiraceae bacterium]
MDDAEIIERFRRRSESAINAMSDKYSRYLQTIALNITGNPQDAEEIVNDTYDKLWNSIPPERPKDLRAFAGKITRNLSINRLERERAAKRGGGQVELILHELEEYLGDNQFDTAAESETIYDALNSFLAAQNEKNRLIFVSRYWRAVSLEEIADGLGITVGKVKSILFRMRKKLRIHLESEGIYL